MSAWFCILLTLLLLPPYLLADETVVERPPQVQLSAKMQELLATIKSPEEALQESQKYQKEGLFGMAKIVLVHGIDLAKSSGQSFSELSNELEYEMPVLRAKELLVLGKPDEAEKILSELAEKFTDDQRRSAEITALQSALAQSRLLASARQDNEEEVTRAVRERLSRYYDQYDAFPVYSALNKLLPPGDSALQNYEIVYYKAVPNAYRLVLRNLHNPDNLIRIEATGLIK